MLNNKKNLKKCLQNQNKKVYTEKKIVKKEGEMEKTEFHKNFVCFHILRLFFPPLVTLIAGGA